MAGAAYITCMMGRARARRWPGAAAAGAGPTSIIMAIRTLLPALVGLADIAATHALDNGLGLTPGSIR
eukprot:COSAG05_NODE_470_length_9504_cov_260.657629_5_plen_68_part_00